MARRFRTRNRRRVWGRSRRSLTLRAYRLARTAPRHLAQRCSLPQLPARALAHQARAVQLPAVQAARQLQVKPAVGQRRSAPACSLLHSEWGCPSRSWHEQWHRQSHGLSAYLGHYIHTYPIRTFLQYSVLLHFVSSQRLDRHLFLAQDLKLDGSNTQAPVVCY